jgi:5-formyltetrahydrofolate cyclo-ligase
MNKREIRAAMKRKLAAMSAEERLIKSALIEAGVLALPEFIAAKCVLAYASFGTEVQTDGILRASLAAGKRLALPRAEGRTHLMSVHEVKDLDRDLETSPLGFRQPRASCPAVALSEVDFVMAPGIAFTTGCERLGRGAGHYDRLLANSEVQNFFRTGLAFELQIIAELSVDLHDVNMDCVVTETRVIRR